MRKSLLLGAILGLAMTPAMAEEVTLFAAGSLKAALSEVAKDYSTAYGVPVDTSFGASGLVRERIEAGEAAHVFASANMRHPRTLVLWIWQASEGLEATARHAIYGEQWRRLDREMLGLLQDRSRV